MNTRAGTPLRPIVAFGASLLLALTGVSLGAMPAYAAEVLTVTSTSDGDSNDACTDTTVTDADSPTTLRNALCVASNLGGEVEVVVPAGEYLVDDALVFGTQEGSEITLQGAGVDDTIIRGTGTSQVMAIDPGAFDPGATGGIAVTIDGVTIADGIDALYGGGGILAGSGLASTADTLTITNSKFVNNSTTVENAPGGAVQMAGGVLVIDNTVFEGNSTTASQGGAVMYQANAAATGESLSITNSTFDGNSVNGGTTAVGGGAVAVNDLGIPGATPLVIDTSTFTLNTASGATDRGGAIFLGSGTLAVTRSSFTQNVTASPDTNAGSVIFADNGSRLTAHYNRIAGNTVLTAAIVINGNSDLSYNWWGCNGGPGAPGCAGVGSPTAIGAVPYLVFAATPAAADVWAPNTLEVTATMKGNSGELVSASQLSAFVGKSVSWALGAPAGASLSSNTGAFDATGTASTTFDQGAGSGPAIVTALFDNSAVGASFAANVLPGFTSAATADAEEGEATTISVTTSGYPAPVITSVGGSLPTGLTFLDNGDGTATIAGTPAAGTGGVYTFMLKATALGESASQTLTLTVAGSANFTSDPGATFLQDSAGTFTVTAEGIPAVTSITRTGALPNGVSFTDNGDGTATIAGTPSEAGEFAVTLTAISGGQPSATQTFTLIVQKIPNITSPATSTFVTGEQKTFDITVGSYYPAPVTISASGTLPLGLAFTDNGNGTATISGTVPLGTHGDFPIQIAASNDAGTSPAQTLVLTVNERPYFTSLASRGIQQSMPVDFMVETSGTPAVTSITHSALPVGLQLTDLGNGTARIHGSSLFTGTTTVTLTATSSVSSVQQQLVITTFSPPTFTSADSHDFVFGDADGEFVIQLGPSFPSVNTWSWSSVAGFEFVPLGSAPASVRVRYVDAAPGTYQSTFTVTNSYSSATQTLTFRVVAPPAIAIQPSNQSATAGQDVVFVAGAAPGATTPTVQWQRSANGTQWSDIAGATSASYQFTTAQADDGAQFRAVFSNIAGTATTSAVTLTVGTGPVITSLAAATWQADAGEQEFLVEASGIPDAAFSSLTALPSWLELTDNHDGTATLTGDPGRAEAGIAQFTLNAANGFGTAATQLFTLTVTVPPIALAPTLADATVGAAYSATVQATAGFPAATTLAVTSALPTGLSFVDGGDGSGTITGTPAAGEGGDYTVTLSASNGTGAPSTVTAPLRVLEQATFTSADTATFVRGVESGFTIATEAGYPVATTIALAETLPAGLNFTDNGDGTATISGTTDVAAASVPLTFTASNGVGTAPAQALTLSIVNAAVVELPETLPEGDGALAGVPATVQREQVLTVSGTGFAAGAPITVGMYSAPIALATVVADEDGAFTATITVPQGAALGAHSFVASGVTPDGTDRFLRADTRVELPVTPSTPAAPGGGLSATGVPFDVGIASLLAAIAFAGGILLVVRGARRRRSGPAAQ